MVSSGVEPRGGVGRLSLAAVLMAGATAGCLVAHLAARASRVAAPGRRVSIAVLSALALVLPSAIQIVRYDRLLSRTDGRVLASEWIAEEVPEGIGRPGPNMSIYRRR